MANKHRGLLKLKTDQEADWIKTMDLRIRCLTSVVRQNDCRRGYKPAWVWNLPWNVGTASSSQDHAKKGAQPVPAQPAPAQDAPAQDAPAQPAGKVCQPLKRPAAAADDEDSPLVAALPGQAPAAVAAQDPADPPGLGSIQVPVPAQNPAQVPAQQVPAQQVPALGRPEYKYKFNKGVRLAFRALRDETDPKVGEWSLPVPIVAGLATEPIVAVFKDGDTWQIPVTDLTKPQHQRSSASGQVPLWTGRHTETFHELKLIQKPDRALLLALMEQGRQIDQQRVGLPFGVLDLPQPRMMPISDPTVVACRDFYVALVERFQSGEWSLTKLKDERALAYRALQQGGAADVAVAAADVVVAEAAGSPAAVAAVAEAAGPAAASSGAVPDPVDGAVAEPPPKRRRKSVKQVEQPTMKKPAAALPACPNDANPLDAAEQIDSQECVCAER